MIYLDTSAAAKLVCPEAESAALATYLAAHIDTPLVSSALLYPELLRAVTRNFPHLADRAVALAHRVMIVPLADDIVISAATIGSPLLRTLDALHLATAVTIASELEAFVTYDKRLSDVAIGIGVAVVAPV